MSGKIKEKTGKEIKSGKSVLKIVGALVIKLWLVNELKFWHNNIYKKKY